MVNTTALVGMKQICQVIPRSETTILSLKRQYPNMPIHRERKGHEWLSDSVELQAWWRMYVKGEAHKYGNGIDNAEESGAEGGKGEGQQDLLGTGESAPGSGDGKGKDAKANQDKSKKGK